jgi:RNA polymerase sigma-70 factor (family 1)
MKEQDQQLTDLFARDEQQAFKQLFVQFYKPMCVAARLYTSESVEAEDIVQQVFIKFWEEKHYKKVNSSYKHFLHISVRNACFNHTGRLKTRQKRENNVEQEALVEQAIDFLLQREELKVFETAYDELPPQSRKVFELVYFADQPYKAAAQKLNISVNTVKTHLKNALRILRNSKAINNYYSDRKKAD